MISQDHPQHPPRTTIPPPRLGLGRDLDFQPGTLAGNQPGTVSRDLDGIRS